MFTARYNAGVIKDLITTIPESYFDVSAEGQVEIIGWLYQYYNTVPKDIAFKKRKYLTSDIPAVTQLFTPSWIVKYLVENSLGRYWIDILHTRGDSRSDQEIATEFDWKYYMPEAPENLGYTNAVNKEVQEIKFLDPAMGSGHILVYAYEVFMQIYESEGYTKREASSLILNNNLVGLDIDTRAYQLSYFTLQMMGRKFDRRFFNREHELQLADVPQSNHVTKDFEYLITTANVANSDKALKDIDTLLELFNQGNDLGSIVKISSDIDFEQLEQIANVDFENGEVSFDQLNAEELKSVLQEIIKSAKMLAQKYDIAVSNPPYMGSGKMNDNLKKYIKKNYPNSKADLFAVFMEKLLDTVSKDGYIGMITQHAWMFLSSYEALRAKLQRKTIVNLAHLGTRAFEEIGGEVVQSAAFILKNEHNEDYIGTYERLVDYGSQDAKEEKYLEILATPTSKDLYRTNQANFEKIPGGPIAYWVSEKIYKIFYDNIKLSHIAYSFQGIITGDNKYYLRFWHEPSFDNIKLGILNSDMSHFNNIWVPYNKGGEFRKWYGNNDYVLRWINNGNNLTRSRSENKDYYFKPGVTWSFLTSGNFSSRAFGNGFLWDVSGSSIFPKRITHSELIALMNNIVAQYVLDLLNPTLNYQVMNILDIPVPTKLPNTVKEISTECISISATEWNSFEVSWDFAKHPLIQNIDEHEKEKLVPLPFLTSKPP
ncbi:BREX-1 system adenine-specific DNA-methyltransferase PglX [Ligilactobacillus equi]